MKNHRTRVSVHIYIVSAKLTKSKPVYKGKSYSTCSNNIYLYKSKFFTFDCEASRINKNLLKKKLMK